MSRVHWPTRNTIGVRTVKGYAIIPTTDRMGERTLSGMGIEWHDWRAPAEGAPRAAMSPAVLGAVMPVPPRSNLVLWRPGGNFGPSGFSNQSLWQQQMAAAAGQPTAQNPVSAAPTPTVSVPAATPSSVMVTSGGGTPAPSTPSIPATGVPAGTPTNIPYVDPSGNVWQYSTASGAWQIMGTPQTTPPSATATTNTVVNSAVPSVGVPVGEPTTASPYTDPSGNVWVFNTATGTWQLSTNSGAAASLATTSAPASESFSDQVAAWLGSSTTIAGYAVPNPVLAGVVIIAAAMFMGKKK